MLAGCGERDRPAPQPTPTATATATPAFGFAVGITEPNPNFLPGPAPPDFARWQPQLQALNPTYIRLVVSWGAASNRDGSLNPTAAQSGCLRDKLPCAGWAGVRGQLEAIARAQARAPGRCRILATVFDTPGAVAAEPSGCEPDGITDRSRAPADLGAYQRMIQSVNAEAARAGVRIEFWSPWNEPNHPYFLSPQRATCDPTSELVAAGTYVGLARAMQAVLEPGQQLVVGELGGVSNSPRISTDADAFARALPEDLRCAPVFSVHGYAPADNPVPRLEQALAPCTPPLWITETGTKRGTCATLAARLAEYDADPRIQAVFPYTFREDDVFPTGMVSTDLTRAEDTLPLWTSGVCL